MPTSSNVARKKERASKEVYAENKKIATAKKRAKRKEMIENGEKDKLRMSFFTTIIESIGIPYYELAKQSGFSQQLISWWISTDDCKYSNVVKILETLNIKITPSFQPKNQTKSIFSSEQYKIEVENLPFLLNKNEKNELLMSCIEKNGRLAFLAQFIVDQKLNLGTFSSIVEINYNLLYRWLLKDDIKISSLYQIADKMDQTIVWKIEPLKLEKNENK